METTREQEAINEALETVLKDTSFADYINEDFEDFDECIEYLQERIYEEEMTYYYNAMQYLMEHDQSLSDSIELACKMGYETASINSELLATLLLQQNLQEELSELHSEIEECFNVQENYVHERGGERGMGCL